MALDFPSKTLQTENCENATEIIKKPYFLPNILNSADPTIKYEDRIDIFRHARPQLISLEPLLRKLLRIHITKMKKTKKKEDQEIPETEIPRQERRDMKSQKKQSSCPDWSKRMRCCRERLL